MGSGGPSHDASCLQDMTTSPWYITLELLGHALPVMPPYTPKQGQYLAFIYYYTKVNGRPPAQTDLQRYFRVTPPTVHHRVVKLEQLGLLERKAGTARSIRVLLPRHRLPDLD